MDPENVERQSSIRSLENRIRGTLIAYSSEGKALRCLRTQRDAIVKEYLQRLEQGKKALVRRRIYKSKESITRLFTKANMPKIDSVYLVASKHQEAIEQPKNPFCQSPAKSISLYSRQSISPTFDEDLVTQDSQLSPYFGRRDDSLERDEVPLLPTIPSSNPQYPFAPVSLSALNIPITRQTRDK
jgi:hypothetical protein